VALRNTERYLRDFSVVHTAVRVHVPGRRCHGMPGRECDITAAVHTSEENMGLRFIPLVLLKRSMIFAGQ
jgi:hypothetical protein